MIHCETDISLAARYPNMMRDRTTRRRRVKQGCNQWQQAIRKTGGPQMAGKSECFAKAWISLAESGQIAAIFEYPARYTSQIPTDTVVFF
jgi:hypothetical protein